MNLKSRLHFICFLIFSFNCFSKTVSIDSTRAQITRHLVSCIIYEKKQVEKKLKLVKSTAEAEKLYLDFDNINARLMNKLKENEIYLMSCMSMHDVDFKKLPDSLSNIVKTVKKANIVVRAKENMYFSFELDYELKIFKNYVTPDFKAYLELQCNGSKYYNKYDPLETYLRNTEQGIIEYELFLKKFKKNNWQREEIKRSVGIEFQDYVFGFEYNETVTEYHKFKKKSLKEFNRFIQKYPKSKSAQFLKKLLSEYAKYKNTDSLQAYFNEQSYVFINQFK